MIYAIVESGGKQYRVEKGTRFLVDRLSASEGDSLSLRAVAFADDGEVVLDAGELEKVKVEARVAEHVRGPKLRIFKYRPKKGYRRRAGHRSELTRLEITEVKKLSRKPAAKKAAAAEKETAEKEKAAPRRKPAARKPAAKKPAAKKEPASKRRSAGGQAASGQRSTKKKKTD
jgi:large subunit ribosomal protein L21